MKYFQTDFTGITVYILASNETTSLSETIKQIKEYCPDELLYKITILPKNRECPAAFEAERLVADDKSGKIDIYYQKVPGILNCVAEMVQLVESSHFILMSADFEMDPSNIRTFAEKAKENPYRVVCASKWIKGSSVTGYGRIKEVANRILNVFVSLLYGKRITDVFSVYQVYPSALAKRIKLGKNSDVSYLFTLVILKLNIDYEEIPTVYIHRNEGSAVVSRKQLLQAGLSFLFYSIKVRKTSIDNILK